MLNLITHFLSDQLLDSQKPLIDTIKLLLSKPEVSQLVHLIKQGPHEPWERWFTCDTIARVDENTIEPTAVTYAQPQDPLSKQPCIVKIQDYSVLMMPALDPRYESIPGKLTVSFHAKNVTLDLGYIHQEHMVNIDFRTSDPTWLDVLPEVKIQDDVSITKWRFPFDDGAYTLSVFKL